MKSAPLYQISMATSAEAEDAVAELLARLFRAPSTIYTDAETRLSVASVWCRDRRAWNAASRTALRAGLADLRSAGIDLGPARISARRVAPENWAESWKRHFKPISVGSRLLVRPGWIKRRPRPGQAVVVLDPGLSFGTGNHPTTLFCLREVAAHHDASRPEASFWDAGTGSGILAIAAAKLGYARVDAVDFDPQAVRVARDNARRNRVSHLIHLTRRDLSHLPPNGPRQYDLICANLISTLLVTIRDPIVRRLRPDGTLVLAGILAAEFDGILRAYGAAGLKLLRSRTEGECRSGAFGFQGVKFRL
jgi:ribosomal protein L11 methyltransferase